MRYTHDYGCDFLTIFFPFFFYFLADVFVYVSMFFPLLFLCLSLIRKYKNNFSSISHRQNYTFQFYNEKMSIDNEKRVLILRNLTLVTRKTYCYNEHV